MALLIRQSAAMTASFSKSMLASLRPSLSASCSKCLLQQSGARQTVGVYARHASNVGHTEKQKSSRKQDIIADKSSFREIYKFNHILFVRALSVTKIYQTGLTLLACPLLGYVGHLGLLSQPDVFFGAGVTMVATVMLYVMSRFIQRIAGIVYMHDDGTKVLVSHLTFWGNRRDVVLDINNVVPLTDENQNVTDIYLRISTFDKRESFFMFLKYGVISDKEALFNILGDINVKK